MATDLASFLQAADLGAYQPQLEALGVVAPVDIADVEDQVGGRTQTSLPSPALAPRSPRARSLCVCTHASARCATSHPSPTSIA